MPSIQMIAIDLDDTLLRDDISVSDYTKDVLRKVLERGVKLLLPRAACSRLPVPGEKPSASAMFRSSAIPVP